MPRQQGAQPVVGGQVNPQMLESIRLQNQYSQQTYLTAMETASREKVAKTQAGATTAAAGIGAASRERVAGIQAGTTQEMAAMQQSAEDERASERILDAQKARDFSIKLEDYRGKLRAQEVETEREYKESMRQQGIKETAAVEEKADWIGANQELLDRFDTAVSTKVAITGGAQRINSREALAGFQTRVNDMTRKYWSEQDGVSTVTQLVTDAMDSSDVFTHASERAQKSMERLGVTRPPKFWTIGMEWGTVTDPKKEAEATSLLIRSVEQEITKIVGDRTNHQMGLGGFPGTLSTKIRNGQVKYGELFHGLAAYKTIRQNLRDEITALSADPKSEEASPERATIKAYQEIITRINTVVNEARAVRDDKSNPQLQTMVADALSIIAGRGLGEKLRGIERPEDIDVTSLVETLRKEIQSIGAITFLGPEELRKKYQAKVKYKRGNIDELTALLLQELGKEGGFGGTITDELEAMLKTDEGGIE